MFRVVVSVLSCMIVVVLPSLVSPLGHDSACDHEHKGSKELHEHTKNKPEDPLRWQGEHLGKNWVRRELSAVDVFGGPSEHDRICNSDTEERKRHADSPEEL